MDLRNLSLPNLEEWASLCLLVDADVVENDVFGVKVAVLIEGLCLHALTASDELKLRAGDKISLEIVAKDLQRQINLEAKLNGKVLNSLNRFLWKM
jgi:hypothetical protein